MEASSSAAAAEIQFHNVTKRYGNNPNPAIKEVRDGV